MEKGEVKLGKWTFKGPKSWEQLSPKQYLQWVRWHLLGAPDNGLHVLLRLWFGIRYRHLRRLQGEQRIFLFDEVFAWLSQRPDQWMLPRLRVFLHRYRGPGNRLEHLSFGEFVYAESTRSGLDEQPTKAQLAELAAALYRPYQPGAAGQRLGFNRASLDSQIKRFGWIPMETLEGIRINYFGCIDQLSPRFPFVYPKSSGGGEEPCSWLDVGLSLARQTGALGTFHQMEETNVYLVLSVLNDVLREQAELAALTKKEP